VEKHLPSVEVETLKMGSPKQLVPGILPHCRVSREMFIMFISVVEIMGPEELTEPVLSSVITRPKTKLILGFTFIGILIACTCLPSTAVSTVGRMEWVNLLL
jgi:hypothetical protein